MRFPNVDGESFTQSVSGRVRPESNSARLVRGAILRGRLDLFGCCGVRRQSPAPPVPRLFACPPSPCPRRSRAFFRRRIQLVCGHKPRPDRRESRTSVQISRLLPVRSWSLISTRRRYHTFLIEAQHAAPLQSRRKVFEDYGSTGAELPAKIFFECGNNFGGEIAGLRVGERRFAALKRDADE